MAEVIKKIANAWTEVGRAFLGPCGGQVDDVNKPKVPTLPAQRDEPKRIPESPKTIVSG